MKRKVQIAIIVLALSGLLIEIGSYMFDDPFMDGNQGFDFIRGLSLFKYFTIQSNLIVFLYFLLGLSSTYSSNDLFKKLLPGVVIYITITFVVFAIMLQGTFEVTGIRIAGNYLVHYIVPILSILYLVLYNEYQPELKDIMIWIIYPLGYILFVIIYGSITSDYLYPFFDMNTISVLQFIITVVLLVIFFLILSFITVKIVSKKELTKN